MGNANQIKSEWQPHLEADIAVFQLPGQPASPAKQQDDAAAAFKPLPPEFGAKLPPVNLVPRPLSPSSAALLIEPEAEPDTASPVFGASGKEGSAAIRRGLATHRLLEVLPAIAEPERRTAAERYLSRARDLAGEDTKAIFRNVFAVLDNPAFAPVFASGSRAEVPLMGTLTVKGRERIISGKIDRIAVEEKRVLIVDYKTGSHPSAMPQSYVTQMALYRAMIGQLYPGRKVEAALLFTASATLHSLPGPMLDAALEALTDS
jgi:ATP-dependent helicase/nuclease subunit A